jgi:SAM-dependent methyltransferase
MPAKNATSRFSDRVTEYVKYRPDYPKEVIDLLQRRCGLTIHSTVADIGSGPGNLARLFCENGNRVFAVEPNAEMRNAGQELLGAFPNYYSVEGTAEDTQLPSGSVQFVTAAQAFHWFDWERARNEFRRILAANGWVVLIWNERVTNSTAFLRDYEHLLLEYGTDYKEVRHERSYKNIDLFFTQGYERVQFENRQVVNFDGLRGRLLSSSYVPGVDHPQRQSMLHRLESIFNKHQLEDRVAIEYEVRMYFGHLG